MVIFCVFPLRSFQQNFPSDGGTIKNLWGFLEEGVGMEQVGT